MQLSKQFVQRLITGLVLVALVIGLLFLLPFWAFVLINTILFIATAWEWCQLMKWRTPRQYGLFTVILVALFFFSWYVNIFAILILACIGWLIAFTLLCLYPTATRWIKRPFAGFLVGYFLLWPCWAALNYLRVQGAGYLLLGLFLIWSADTGAYFAGKQWGKHYVTPRISPKKTLEGLVGGFILTLAIGVIGLLCLSVPTIRWPLWLVLIVGVFLASVIGDLFESMVKRIVDIKDSGNILPGHGGLLDRLDSMLCALPVYALGIWFLSGAHLV